MTIAQQIAHSFLDNIEKMIVRNNLDVGVLDTKVSYQSCEEAMMYVTDTKSGSIIATMRLNLNANKLKRKIYEKKCFKQEQEGKKVTGLSIDVIKNQIRLSKMFAGSEAVSTKALKELLEYKETGLTPQDIKDIDKMYLEKCQQVNKLTCTCEMYERMAKK